MMKPYENLCFSKSPNLADPRLGAKVVFATDDFFGDKSRLIKPEAPVFIEGKYDDNGKWMDGWESRRKRVEGYDFCIIELGKPALIDELVIDTSHFTGNYPSAVSVDVCFYENSAVIDVDKNDELIWHEVLAASPVSGNNSHNFSVDFSEKVTHLRLNIYPDGGVARFRVHGKVLNDHKSNQSKSQYDLLAMENGSRGIVANDEHFGKAQNITLPGKAETMGEGWETRRRRQPGNDWAIFELACPGIIDKIELDTAHFKGNFPDQCSIQAALIKKATSESLVTQSMFWQEILPPQSLAMDTVHHFVDEVNHHGMVSHVRVNIFPDGGISRLRLFGKTQ